MREDSCREHVRFDFAVARLPVKIVPDLPLCFKNKSEREDCSGAPGAAARRSSCEEIDHDLHHSMRAWCGLRVRGLTWATEARARRGCCSREMSVRASFREMKHERVIERPSQRGAEGDSVAPARLASKVRAESRHLTPVCFLGPAVRCTCPANAGHRGDRFRSSQVQHAFLPPTNHSYRSRHDRITPRMWYGERH